MLQRSRLFAFTTLAIVLLLFLVLEGRLFVVQILHHSHYRGVAAYYQIKEVKVEVPRGSILDRKGEALALSIPAVDVWADNRDLDKPWTNKDEKKETVELLASILDLDSGQIYENLSKAIYRPIKRNVTDSDTILQLFHLKKQRFLRGIILERKYARRYPLGALLGHTLGVVNYEGRGVFGIESHFDSFLTGREGARVFRKDGVQNEIYSPHGVTRFGRPGGSVQLTVDTAVQLFAELELARIEQLYRPKWAAAVVMEPFTGRILAAAGIPSLDPSNLGGRGTDHWLNRAFSAQYIPGSTFKPLTMAMAIDRGVVDLNESIDCEGGTWFYKGRRISDVHVNYRNLDPAGIIFKSSNIGISKIALRMVPEETPKGGKSFQGLIDTLHLLGFGRRTGILPAKQESGGQVRPLKDWSRKYSLVSISFGNEIAVTPIQMAAAVCVLVNGGLYVPPRLVDRMRTSDGREIDPPEAPSCRVFSEKTSRIVKEMMVKVVEEGTGKKARISGVKVGGKTGTAEKLPQRVEVTSSFVAFAPADQPALVVVVVVDEPQGAHYASIVAAPHVRAILERSLSHLNQLCKSNKKKEAKEKES